MMLLILISRDDSVHIVDLKDPLGNYWTMCGEDYSKKDKINTIVVDNTFPGICVDCKIFADMSYEIHLDDLSKSLRTDLFILSHRKNYLGPKAKFGRVANHSWKKLVKYKSLTIRKKDYE